MSFDERRLYTFCKYVTDKWGPEPVKVVCRPTGS